MTIATHIIKIKGTFDKNIWKDEKELRDYVDNKIKNEIDSLFHTDIELFSIDGEKIEVWVFVSAFPSEVKNRVVEKWIKGHIKEEGISVTNFEIETIFDMTEDAKENNFVVFIP